MKKLIAMLLWGRAMPGMIGVVLLGTLDLQPQNSSQETPEYGIYFSFKGKNYQLRSPMRHPKAAVFQRGGLTAAQLDSAANLYYTDAQYVEIIRQDNPVQPETGVALGFEFDSENADFPYTPSRAVLQLKNFSWGGVEFSQGDTLNYTGVSNDVSDDLSIEIDSYRDHIIIGHFSGLLLNGNDGMANIDSGYFRVRVYEK